jgi:hypothetical protein
MGLRCSVVPASPDPFNFSSASLFNFHFSLTFSFFFSFSMQGRASSSPEPEAPYQSRQGRPTLPPIRDLFREELALPRRPPANTITSDLARSPSASFARLRLSSIDDGRGDVPYYQPSPFTSRPPRGAGHGTLVSIRCVICTIERSNGPFSSFIPLRRLQGLHQRPRLHLC